MASSLLQLLLLLLLLPALSVAETSVNFTLGSSLTAIDNSSYLASPSGEFGFGFQQIGSGGFFLLAIWFNKIPEKTIIWSANCDNLVQRGSKVHLTSDGEFMLNDPTGKQIWKADPICPGVSHAAMLDTGNFVLASEDSTLLWESFNHPTDTMVPSQILNQGSKLVARISDMSYSRGRFLLTLQEDGNLVLSHKGSRKGSTSTAYWSSQAEGGGLQVVFNQSGHVYLSGTNSSILQGVFSTAASTRDFYQRAILEHDGVFRHYVYPKKTAVSSAGSRPMTWTSLASIATEKICTIMNLDTGSGPCGFNGYCTMGDDQRPICRCPPGYTFLDPQDGKKGCKQNFLPQSCRQESPETNEFDFENMTTVDWPLADYEHFQGVTVDWCKNVCLDDCFCAVAIFGDGDCWKKKTPLSNGRFDPSNGRLALIKVRKGNSTWPPNWEGFKKKDRSTLIITGSVLIGSSVFLNLLLLLAAVMFIFYFNDRKSKIIEPRPVMEGANLRSFTYGELEVATDGFKHEIGRGAFATVYKGTLAHDNGDFVAVKRLDRKVLEGEQEFETEANIIGRTNHKNLVQLLGFCNEGEHQLLVHEFMSNGSLSSFLFGKSRPSWYHRIQIILGTARGLLYLHEECSTQIIHCDIKPQNILLDDGFTARISNFGLAKLLQSDQTRTMTGIRGTRGYLAPEWFKTVPITVKVDVYSFGILLLELIFCRKNFELELELEDEDQVVLADWAYDCYKEGKLDLILENDKEALNDIETVRKFVMIVFWCIQEDPSKRPTMKTVAQMLEGALEVYVPPDPSSFISSICFSSTSGS